MKHIFSKYLVPTAAATLLVGFLFSLPYYKSLSFAHAGINQALAIITEPEDPDEGPLESDPPNLINYRHARFLISTSPTASRDTGTDSPNITLNNQTQATRYVLDDHNGKFFVDSCTSGVPWVSVSCPSDNKVRGPMTINGVKSVPATITVTPQTSCPTGGCVATITINTHSASGTKFKWSCPHPSSACDPSSVVQTTSRTINLTYVPAVQFPPLTCSGPTSGNLGEQLTFTATGGDTNSVYNWSTPGAIDSSPGTQVGTVPTFSLRFNGPQGGSRTVQVVRGSETCTRTVNLNAPPPPAQGDFSISLAPSTQQVDKGGQVNYTATVSALNGFTGTINLKVQDSDNDLLASTFIVPLGPPDPRTILQFTNGQPATQTVNFNIQTTQSTPPRPDFNFKVTAYTSAAPIVTKYATSILNVIGGCNGTTPPCGTYFPPVCLPASQTRQVGETAHFLSSGGGPQLLWSAPSGNPSCKLNGTITGGQYNGQCSNIGLGYTDGQFDTAYNAAGTYQVTLKSEGLTSPPCYVTVTAAPQPPVIGALSCTISAVPSTVNPAYGTVNVTINGMTNNTRCTYSCVPGSSGCPTLFPFSGTGTISGGNGYGPILSSQQIRMTCNRPAEQGATAATASCGPISIGPAGGGSCTAPQSNPYFTCSNGTCMLVQACGISSSGCTQTGQACGGPPPASGYNCSSGGTCVQSTSGAGQYATLAQCQAAPACAPGANTPTCTITGFDPSPLTAGPNAKTLVSWTSTNATLCYTTAGPWYSQNLAPSGSIFSNVISSSPPGGATTFGMKCMNAAGVNSVQCTRVLSVVNSSSTTTTTTGTLTVSCVSN